MKTILDFLTNREQKAIIARMEILRNAMYANTPDELRYYLNQLN